ncbi:MAG TPA: hypothetical protein VN914_01605, partial [Polyangia bacterium]|nr:hypothetical protein [Polyangia bacterium]
SDTWGAFSGTVTVAASLELVPLAGGASQWRSYTLTLDLAGTWGLAAAAGKGASLPASASNVILFTQKSGSLWVKSAQTAPQLSAEDPNPGQLVLQPTDAALGWLNPVPR